MQERVQVQQQKRPINDTGHSEKSASDAGVQTACARNS
jgi:hypothetical protein